MLLTFYWLFLWQRVSTEQTNNPATNGKDEQKLAAAYLNRLSNKRFTDILLQHKKDFNKYMQRVSLDLGSSANQQYPIDQRLKKFAAGEADNGLISLYFQFGRLFNGQWFENE